MQAYSERYYVRCMAAPKKTRWRRRDRTALSSAMPTRASVPRRLLRWVLRPKVDVFELIAWELDEYPYRESATGLRGEEFARQVERAQQKLAERECHASYPALLVEEGKSINHLFAECRQRSDLQAEYEGLDWTLGVVDLRHLLAFQRRLVLGPRRHISRTPQQNDWPHLISFTVGSRRGTEHHFVRTWSATGASDFTLHSNNPELEMRCHPKA